MNGWRLANEFLVRRSLVLAGLIALMILPARIGNAQEAASDAAEAAADTGERAERLLEVQQRQQELKRRQSGAAERDRMRTELAELQAQLESQRQRAAAQSAEFEAQRKAHAQVLAEFERSLGRGGARDKADEQVQRAHQQLEMIEAKLKERALQQQSTHAAPLPENASFNVFKLKFVQADEVAAAVSKVMMGQSPRMAVDERSNTLLAIGDDAQIANVRGVLQALDVPDRPAAVGTREETLQLRIVWLLDGVDGGKSPDRFVSPQVVEALEQLGFTKPRVVTQQVTTLTLDDERRRGQFQFHVPVLIGGQSWQFAGTGQIGRIVNERFSLNVELEYVRDPNSASDRGRLSGSIFTPLGHYTVIGTTTFVGSLAAAGIVNAEGVAVEGIAAEGNAVMPQQEYLSAFVVYLDRAKEFPDKVRRPTTAPARTSAE